MNLNASSSSNQGSGRKLNKRPTDAPGLEVARNLAPPPTYNSYDPQQYNNSASAYDSYSQNQPSYPPPPNPYGVGGAEGIAFNVGGSGYGVPPGANYGAPPGGGYGAHPGAGYGAPPGAGYGAPPPVPGMAMPAHLFTDPLVANVAMSYGSKIVGSGKQLVDREIEKYVPVARLKYYFAVDTAYVLSKLKLIFFPFTHSDWSVKYEQNEPVQPRYEVNAPDLYIPTMAYVTYVLVAGMALGTQHKFAPEVLGMLASSALAWTLVEILVALVTLYVTNIQTKLKTFDLVAFAGYKYVGIIFAVLLSIVLNSTGYYIGLLYSGLSLAFFTMRSLKWQVLADVTGSQHDVYGGGGYGGPANANLGNKRRLYFLLCMAAMQPLLMWWLSYHLVPETIPSPPPPIAN